MVVRYRSPLEPSEAWEWRLEGRCRGEDPSIFFHPDGERGRARVARTQRAKAICERCAVSEQCRQWAISVGEPFGIWGGMSEDERARVSPTRLNVNGGWADTAAQHSADHDVGDVRFAAASSTFGSLPMGVVVGE